MTDTRIHATVTTDDGTYTGDLWRGAPPPEPPLPDIGLTPIPRQYREWFPAVGGRPAFCRIFSPPGAGLPNPAGPMAFLPDGTLPWISHKDPLPIDDVAYFWRSHLPVVPGRTYRWTYHHEAAPGDEVARRSYRSYWDELVDAARDHRHIELVQIQSNYAMRWRPDTDWRDWMIPGVTLGFDCYPLAGYRYEPPESMFGLLREAAEAIGAPTWGVPELGADPRPPQDRGDWLTSCYDYLTHAGAAFIGLWCAKDNARDYRPTDPGTLEAFRQILGAGR